jgi:hypothetical protein
VGLKEALRWDKPPGGLQDCLDNWLSIECVDYGLKLFALATVLRVLWNIRNKVVMEGVFVRNPVGSMEHS